MKLYDLYYWNKHEYCWKTLTCVEGKDKTEAITRAKGLYPEFVARGDVMKVELTA